MIMLPSGMPKGLPTSIGSISLIFLSIIFRASSIYLWALDADLYSPFPSPGGVDYFKGISFFK
jgi:hypothetical protein